MNYYQNNNQLDILIAIMPKIDPYGPTTGPAGLKSYLASQSLSCKIVDLNVDLYNWLTLEDRNTYWDSIEDTIFTFNNNWRLITTKQRKFLKRCNPWFKTVLAYIKKENPKFLGLSLLTHYSQLISLHLSQLVKKYFPNIKIVWGGGNINEQTQIVLDRKIIDYYIYGDGENALVELLKGNTLAKGINSVVPDQYENLDDLPVPDYDDIDFTKYPNPYNLIYVTGSRGCVKKCTFCDVHLIWPKYKFRNATHVFNEVKTLHEKYGFEEFNFTDSLINGSMKNFRELLQLIKEYKNNGYPRVRWRSQWIMRPANQCDEDDYKLMKESGCSGLEVGLESFSESVRFHMGKKIKDDDMWFCLEMLQKYLIPHSLLMIVGYPTETEEDHHKSLTTLETLWKKGWMDTKGVNGYTLMHFGYGNTLILDETSPLYKQIKDDLTYYRTTKDWKYKDNDFPTRTRRMEEIWNFINSKRGHDPFMEKILTAHLTDHGKKK